jgi:hypothetical protein
MRTGKFPSQDVSPYARHPIAWPACTRTSTPRPAEEETPVTDPSRDPYSKPDATRRWVRVVVIIVIVVALLVGVLLLIGGGHRPRPHF